MQWRREALQAVAKKEKDRSTAQLTAALSWLGLETVPRCGQAYQDNLLHKLINDCCDKTTDWILRHRRMRPWLQNGRGAPVLWLKGKPGSGKSTICAKLVQFLRIPGQSTVLFCFYSYIVSSIYPDPVVFILATLVSQILRQRTDLATYVYEEFVTESRSLSVQNLQELLSNLLPQLVMPRILIDGIDECIRYDMHGKPCDLTPIKDVLVSILQLENTTQACAPTKILIVSRDILELVGKLSKRPTVALDQESDALTADITRYATKSLEPIRDRFRILPDVDNVLQEVKKNVVSKSQGMFLWVRLVLAQLEIDAYNLDDLEIAVTNMPDSLNDFYSRIVHRIMLYSPLSRERTINILKWMLCSRRPLRVTELQDAIVFASGTISISERSKLPANIVDLCKPLIQTDDNGQISFVHFTVQEYLTKSGFVSLQDAESCTSMTCLNYLTFSLNLADPNNSANQKAVGVGKCLYSLQPYVHEHWLDHLLAFAAEVSQARDRRLEACLATFLSIYSHQYTRYPGPTDNTQPDILAARNIEPRLEYLEHYGHHYKLLCVYVNYRHAKKVHFKQPADSREPFDPTPLSVIQLEYAMQVDYLLSAAAVPGLASEQLTMFKASNRPYAFVCRFPGCSGMLAGFPTHDLRTQHETTHKPALFCTHSGCKYSLPFASRQSLGRHMRDFHTSVPRSIPRSIRHRHAMTPRGRSGHAPAPSKAVRDPAVAEASKAVAGPSYLERTMAIERIVDKADAYSATQTQSEDAGSGLSPFTAADDFTMWLSKDKQGKPGITRRSDFELYSSVASKPRKSNLMSLLNDTDPDDAAALSSYQTADGRIPLTPQQRNDVLSQANGNLPSSTLTEERTSSLPTGTGFTSGVQVHSSTTDHPAYLSSEAPWRRDDELDRDTSQGLFRRDEDRTTSLPMDTHVSSGIQVRSSTTNHWQPASLSSNALWRKFAEGDRGTSQEPFRKDLDFSPYDTVLYDPDSPWNQIDSSEYFDFYDDLAGERSQYGLQYAPAAATSPSPTALYPNWRYPIPWSDTEAPSRALLGSPSRHFVDPDYRTDVNTRASPNVDLIFSTPPSNPLLLYEEDFIAWEGQNRPHQQRASTDIQGQPRHSQ